MEFEKEDIEELIKFEIAEAVLRFGEGVKAPIMRIISLERMLQNKAENQHTSTHSRMIPLTKWNLFYPDPSISAIRGLIQRNVNGFKDYVIEKRGKRVLINEDKYFLWKEKYKKVL